MRAVHRSNEEPGPASRHEPQMERRPVIRTLSRALPLLILFLVAAVVDPFSLAAQGTPGAGLGRPYWHVFIAYALAWVLVLGWVVSIARRLARIERRLEDGDPEGA